MSDLSHIRNFSIIAHIDHGKSTIADRFIQVCGGLAEREMAAQVLDSMDIERERGITIKAQSVTLPYTAQDGKTYQLNFIDTPGHVDFSYEVSRSLAACEGALLIVDAAQGVEAQSVANCYTAIAQGLEVIPVLKKMDLPQAEPEKVINEIENIIGIEATDAVRCSAKTGEGIAEILEELVLKVPPPVGDIDAPLQALIIDSWFDNYLGVVSLVRVMQGTLSTKSKIIAKTIGKGHVVDSVGVFTPKRKETGVLRAGEVGFMVAGIKDILGAPVGDTITFTYATGHNVQQFPDQVSFGGCDFTSATLLQGTGPLVVALSSAGTFYYGCSVGFHCANGGMSLEVSVAPAPAVPGANPIFVLLGLVCAGLLAVRAGARKGPSTSIGA